MANANVNMNFSAFLEKTKLKDDGSNYTDWVRSIYARRLSQQPAGRLPKKLSLSPGELKVLPPPQSARHSSGYRLQSICLTGEATTKGGRQRKKQKDKKQKYKERPNAKVIYT